jgi:hypothetical protein
LVRRCGHRDDGSTGPDDVIAWIVMVAAPTKPQRRSRTSSPSTTRTQLYTVILGGGQQLINEYQRAA